MTVRVIDQFANFSLKAENELLRGRLGKHVVLKNHERSRLLKLSA